MVRGIREMLRFQTEAGKGLIYPAALPFCSAQSAAAIELHSGLICLHLHTSAACRIPGFRLNAVWIQDEAMVIFPAGYGSAGTEIEIRSAHVDAPSGGNETGIHFQIAIRIEIQFLIQHLLFAGEIEITVVRQVDDRIRVCLCRIV